MWVEQLRGDYNVSELFQEERVLSPTKPAMKCSLWATKVSNSEALVRKGFAGSHRELVMDAGHSALGRCLLQSEQVGGFPSSLLVSGW